MVSDVLVPAILTSVTTPAPAPQDVVRQRTETGMRELGAVCEWQHSAEFPDHPSSVSGARAFVTFHLGGHDLDRLVDDLQLVVSELATNALLHGQTGFLVILLAVDESVRLEVHDGSQSIPVEVAARTLDVGGRGIAIVSSLSRDWGVTRQQSGGKAVWAEFDQAG